jgi:hypothetical protein
MTRVKCMSYYFLLKSFYSCCTGAVTIAIVPLTIKVENSSPEY